MKSKIERRLMAAIFGIALSALMVMPACDTGGGDGTPVCDILNGEWAVGFTLQVNSCGYVTTTSPDYFTFTIDEETGEVEIDWRDNPGDDPHLYIHRVPVSCDAEGFFIVFPPPPDESDGCVKVDPFFELTGTFDSDSTFHGTLSYGKANYPSGCGPECVDTCSITATRL